MGAGVYQSEGPGLGIITIKLASSWTTVQGQYPCSTGSKTSTYRVWAANSVPPKRPLQLFRFHPHPLFHHHLTPSHARLCREREGAASEWRGTDLCPERRKPPNLRVKYLDKSGGASALNNSPMLHRSTRDLDCLELTFRVADADLKEVGHRPKALPRNGRSMPEALPPHKDKHEIDVLPQGSPSKRRTQGRPGREAPRQGRRKLDAASREDRIEGRLATWNLGRGPTEAHFRVEKAC